MEYTVKQLYDLKRAQTYLHFPDVRKSFTRGAAVKIRQKILGLRFRNPPLSVKEHNALVRRMYRETSIATSISENDIRIAFANLPQIGHGFWDVMNGPGHADWRVMTVEEKASVPRLGMHIQPLLPPSEV